MSKMKVLEEYIAPIGEMLDLEMESSICADSTNNPFDDNTNWDGSNGWS